MNSGARYSGVPHNLLKKMKMEMKMEIEEINERDKLMNFIRDDYRDKIKINNQLL